MEIDPAGQFPSTFSIWINFNVFSIFHCSFLLQNEIQFHLGTFWFQSFQSILIPTHLLSFWYWSVHCNVNQHIFENNGDFDHYNIFIGVTSNHLFPSIFQHWIKTWKILVPARATLRLQLFNYLSQTKVSTATIIQCTFM